jgi:putative transposase
MARPYSTDLRERVVRDVEDGASRRSVAKKYRVSVSFVIKLVQRWRRRGSVSPGQIGGQKSYALAGHAELVSGLVRARPDLTIDELRTELAERGIAVCRSAVGRFLVALGLTRKKRRSMQPSRSGRTWRRDARLGASASRT